MIQIKKYLEELTCWLYLHHELSTNKQQRRPMFDLLEFSKDTVSQKYSNRKSK